MTAPTSPRSVRTDAGRRVLLLTIAAFVLLQACDKPDRDVEAEVAQLVEEAQKSAEAGDDRALARILSADYADPEGRDRRTMGFIVRSWLGRYPGVLTMVTDLSVVAISDQLATAEMTVFLAGRDGNRPLLTGIDTDRVRLELALRHEDGRWLVTGAQWEPPGRHRH